MVTKWFVSDDSVQWKLNGYCQRNSSCYEDARVVNILDRLSLIAGQPNCTKVEQEVITTTVSSDSSNTDLSSNYLVSDGYWTEYQNAQSLLSWSEIGYWNATHTPALTTCLQHESSDVRYSALKALRSVACDKYNYDDLLVTAGKLPEDPYIGIMTYLTLIRCPTGNLSQYLREKLSSNQVNHETTFIWTHLSNMKGDFATNILKDASLNARYDPSALKFSRNFQKDVVVMNKTFSTDLNVVCTGTKLRPQYLSLKILTEDGVELLDFEMRERNSTYSYCETIIKTKGTLVYSGERRLEHSWFAFDFDNIYVYAFNLGLKIISMFSLAYLQKLFGDFEPINYFSKDMLLQYPTSIGMPFHIKLNKTQGCVSEKKTLPSFISKQFDVQLLIDATYTNVGTKIQSTLDVFPGLNSTFSINSAEFIIDMKDKKSKLFDFNLGLYNIENERLSPRYYKNQTVVESYCLPLLRNITGSTICWEYCPQSKWWPVSRAMYSLVYVRDDDILGHNITVVHDDDDACGIYYEEIGNLKQKWYIWFKELAQFVNLKMGTPYFNLHGSGTFATEVLRLQKSGQAMNISGLLSTENEVAPFTMTGMFTNCIYCNATVRPMDV